MLTLPIKITQDTFSRSFLGGDGTLKLETDADLWNQLLANNLEFHRGVDRVADVGVEFKADKPFQIGKQGVLALNVSAGFSAGHQIELVWPDEAGPTLQSYELPELAADELYVELRFHAKGDAGLSGQYQGPVKINFGIQAGGDARYELIRRYKQSQKVPAILGDLFAHVRLPQQIAEKADIPEVGEALRLRYSGYLGLSAQMSWGYAMAGSRSIEIQDLKADFEYSLKLAASVGAKYRLAGEFEVLARRGSRAGWVRYTVRKARHSQFQFAADLGLEADLGLTGLPESADDFLAKLAGADAVSILDKLDKARKFTSLDEIHAQVDLLAQDILERTALKWINMRLSNANLAQVLEMVAGTRRRYEGLDAKVRQLIESRLGKLEDLREAVTFLQDVSTPAKLRARLEEDVPAAAKAWETVELIWGDDLVDLLLDRSETFADFQALIGKADAFLNGGEASNRVIEYLQLVRERLSLDEIFQSLAKIDSPAKLKGLTEKRLRGVAEVLLDDAILEIQASKLGAALEGLHAKLNQINDFKANVWSKVVQTTAKQTFEANLSYRYSRTSERQALVDVEVNLNTSEGQDLAAMAAKGDFSDLLLAYRSKNVHILQGELTSKLAKSAQLQINVLGWSFSSVSTLVQNSEHAIQSVSGGLLHVFTDETSIKQLKSKKNRRGFEEKVASSFLLKSVASILQPEESPHAAIDPATRRFLLRTLPKLSVSYDLLHEADRATVDQLRQYLVFGEAMGLIRSQDPNRSAAEEVAEELKKEFGNPLGKVKIDYSVRYDNHAIQSMLLRRTDDLLVQARQVLRQTISARYIGMPETSWMARLGFAYLDPKQYQRFTVDPLLRRRIEVTLPSWFTGGGPSAVTLPSNEPLRSLFATEDQYLKRLGALDELVDRIRDSQAVAVEDLQKASKEFLAMAGKIDRWAVNAFFAVFDGLIHFDSGGKAVRETAMLMEITPPGAAQPVRKIFQSPGSWDTDSTREEGAVVTEEESGPLAAGVR